MKRKMTTREWILLGVLVVLALVSGYVMLFYMPTTAARDNALAEAESYRNQLAAAQVRLAEKQRMERELNEIAQNPSSVGLPDYDNIQPLMEELSAILSAAQSYSLSFATPDTSESIVTREVSVSFTCDSYIAAKGVLQRLHDSQYRCMLNNINISRGETAYDPATVSAGIVFFECQ